MANNKYVHKDYSALLKELQTKSKKQAMNNNSPIDVTKSTAKDSADNNDTSETNMKSIEKDNLLYNSITMEYDLTAILNSINDITELLNIYNLCTEKLDYEQNLTQDLLHAIEFSEDYKERYKYSTILHYCRQRRRVYKNTIDVLMPIVAYAQKEDTKKVLNKLNNILGESRKIKNGQSNKHYNPRILTNLEVFKNE